MGGESPFFRAWFKDWRENETTPVPKVNLDESIHWNVDLLLLLIQVKKIKATALLQKAGLQLPGGLFRNNGYIHSIREQGSNVKTKFEDVTNGMLVRQNNSAPHNSFDNAYINSISDLYAHVKTHDSNFTGKEASKVVNADGTPNAEQTVLQKRIILIMLIMSFCG